MGSMRYILKTEYKNVNIHSVKPCVVGRDPIYLIRQTCCHPDCSYKDLIVMRDIMLGSGQYNGSSVFVNACRGKFNVVWVPCWWKHKHSRMLTASWPIGNHTAEGGREGGCVGGVGGGGKVYSLTARDRVMQKGPVLEVSCVCVWESSYNTMKEVHALLYWALETRSMCVYMYICVCAHVCVRVATTTGSSRVLSAERISWLCLLAA